MTEAGFFSNTYEQLEDAVVRANDFVAEGNRELVNIETVVLPEMYSEGGTMDPELSQSGNHSSWFQFVRVWYRE